MYKERYHTSILFIIYIGFTEIMLVTWADDYSHVSYIDNEFNRSEYDGINNMSLQNLRHSSTTDKCISNKDLEGVCLSPNECHKREGHVGGLCNTSDELYCCSFLKSCGDMSKEQTTYFHSPDHPSKSTGTLACDYDVFIQDDVCAVRIEYVNVNLARKFGGLCDIDQIFILNSLDGPTTGQCGPLTGYASPKLCGAKREPDLQGEHSDISVVANPLTTILLWWNKIKPKVEETTWWNYPEPVFNTYYYESTKRHMRENRYVNQDAQRRIISGTDSDIGEFPWMVAIGIDKKFFCGGALINNEFVLTAAHCFMTRDTPIKALTVHLGDHDLSTGNETSHELRGVWRIFFHSHFHALLLSNDIALLQLDKPVPFTDYIHPICLPSSGESYKGSTATVTGWGISSIKGDKPTPILQKLNVKVLSNSQCSREIDDHIGAGMLCASPSGLGGTCFGDSGGPLIIEKDEKSILIGLVSFGVTGCAIIPEFPDLYTRVSKYMDWIEVNTT